MSEIKPAKSKSEDVLATKSIIARYIEQLRLLPQKRLLLASCLLHVVFFSFLFINWQSHEPVKPIHIPENIQARVVSLDELKPLQEKKEAEKKIIQDRLEQEKRLAEQKLQKKKEKEAEQKKIAERKKKEAEKQLQIKKKKEEQARLDKEKKLKEQEEKKKQEAEEKRKAELEKKIAQEKLAKERARELKEQESKMLEKLQQIEQQQAQAKALEIENERKRQEQQFLDYELTEKERYMARIKTQIEGLWRIPPKSERLRITLGIRLLPNGELSSVNIINSSGNDAFDRSAILAVKSVRRFLVPDDNKVFERNFRQFNMSFSPE
jgi:colicin import membrane protein